MQTHRYMFLAMTFLVVSSASGNGTAYGSQNANSLEVFWSTDLNAEILASPIVAKRVIYLADQDGRVSALDTRDGSLRWQTRVEDTVSAKPCLYRGLLFIATKSGELSALDATTGAIRWRFKAGGSIVSDPVADSGSVYFGSNDLNVYALATDTGSIKWQFTVEGYKYDGIYAAPELDGERLYIGVKNGLFYALNKKSGVPQWHTQLRSAIYDPARRSGNALFVGAYDRSVYRINAADGRLQWRTDLDDWPQGAPLVHQQQIYIGSSTGTLYVLKGETGRVVWSESLAQGFRHGPVPIDVDRAAIGSVDGQLLIFDLAQNTVLASIDLGTELFSRPVVGGAGLYVAGRDGRIFRLAFG